MYLAAMYMYYVVCNETIHLMHTGKITYLSSVSCRVESNKVVLVFPRQFFGRSTEDSPSGFSFKVIKYGRLHACKVYSHEANQISG